MLVRSFSRDAGVFLFLSSVLRHEKFTPDVRCGVILRQSPQFSFFSRSHTSSNFVKVHLFHLWTFQRTLVISFVCYHCPFRLFSRWGGKGLRPGGKGKTRFPIRFTSLHSLHGRKSVFLLRKGRKKLTEALQHTCCYTL